MYEPVSKLYYVCTTDFGSGMYILGYLRYLSDGEYSFEYHPNPLYRVGIHGAMSDTTKVYGTEDTLKNIICWFATPPSDSRHLEMCECYGLEPPCDNPWKMMEANWDAYKAYNTWDKYPISAGANEFFIYRDLNVRVLNGPVLY